MASRSLLDLIIRTRKTGTGLKDTRREVATLDDRVKGLGQTLTAVSAGAVAIGGTFKKAFDLAKEGAELQLFEGRFQRLGERLRLTEGFLEDVDDAMGGTRSQFELMRSATDLMSLGLVKNEEQLRRLMVVSGELGFDMNQLVLTLTNMTTMRFDALGVSVDGFDEKVKNLEATGLSAAEAFREAFLEQAEEQVEKVGSVADTSAGKIARFESTIKDLADSVKVRLAEGFVAWLDIFQKGEHGVSTFDIVMTDFLNTLAGAPDHTEEWLQGLKELEEAMEQGRTVVDSWSTEFKDVQVEVPPAIDQVASAAERAAQGFHGLKQASDVTWTDMQTGVDGAIQSMIENIEFLSGGGAEIVAAFDQVKDAVDTGLIAPEEALPILEDLELAAIGVKQEVGLISANEAARTVSENFNVAWGEAQELIAGAKEKIDEIPDTITKTILIKIAIDESGMPLPEFQTGGIVAGPVGQPQLAIVHGGERIIPANQTSIMEGATFHITPGEGEDVFLERLRRTVRRL